MLKKQLDMAVSKRILLKRGPPKSASGFEDTEMPIMISGSSDQYHN